MDLGFVRHNRRILVFLPPIHESSKKSARTEKTIFISPIKPVKKPAVSRLDEIAYDSIRTVVLKNAVNQLTPNLMMCGAEQIPGIPIGKIVP